MNKLEKEDTEKELLTMTEKTYYNMVQHELYGLECDMRNDRNALKEIYDIVLSLLKKALDYDNDTIEKMNEIIKKIERIFGKQRK